MTDRIPGARPLDESEQQTLQMIEQNVRRSDPDFPQRLGSRPGVWHPPVRQSGMALRWPLVVAVMLAALVYAGILYLLPDGLTILTVVLTQLVLVPAACLFWAARHGQLWARISRPPDESDGVARTRH